MDEKQIRQLLNAKWESKAVKCLVNDNLRLVKTIADIKAGHAKEVKKLIKTIHDLRSLK